MFEPVTFLAGFLMLWAQLNNYGIDTENPQLKNIRVRRGIESQLYGTHNDKTKDLRINSAIMKSIINGFERNRIKRSYKSNYNGNNNVQNNDYIEAYIPLASYPPNSPYYSTNTASVPYYYNTYNGNNNAYNINNNNNGYSTLNNNGGIAYQNNAIISPDKGPFNGQNNQNTPEKNGKLVVPTNSLTLFNGNNITSYNELYRMKNNYTQGSNTTQGNLNSNSRRFYPFTGSPYRNNQTVMPLNNNGTSSIAFNSANNNGNNADNNTLHNGNNNTVKVQGASIMSGLGCPEFMKSATIFGTKVCIDEDYD